MGVKEERYRATERAIWESVGAEPTERTIDLRRTGASARVQEVGDGPPIVFVHGVSNGGTSWASLAARLDGFRCIVLDRPGCGLSAPLKKSMPTMADMERYADDLVIDVLDALDITKASLIGTSFGGFFVLRTAAAHPDRIDRVVELSWSFGVPVASTPLVMRVASLPALGKLTTRIPASKRMVRSMVKQIGLRQAVESGRFGPNEIAWFQSILRDTNTMRNEIKVAPRVMTTKGFNEETLLRPDVLARITAPTYFLWGAEDPMGGEEIARRFVAQLPNAELEMMTGAGHAPWIDDPDHVAKRVDAFLKG